MTPTHINITLEEAMAILFKIAIDKVEILSLQELTALSYGVDALKTIKDMTIEAMRQNA